MAAGYGRDVAATWNGTPLGGVREKGLEIGGEAVNVTSDEDNGIQTLLSKDAELSHTVSLSGVTKDHVLRLAKASGDIQGTLVLTYEDGYTISGTFNIGAYSEGMPYNDAITFDVTMMSTGSVTHTPAS